MRLAITPITRKGVREGLLIQSIVLSEEDRPRVDLFDFTDLERLLASTRDLPLITMCSYCQQVKDSDHTANEWVDAEHYYRAGGTSEVRIRHGICPTCFDKVQP